MLKSGDRMGVDNQGKELSPGAILYLGCVCRIYFRGE